MSCVPMKLCASCSCGRMHTRRCTPAHDRGSRVEFALLLVLGVGLSASRLLNPEALLPTSHCLILGRKRQRRRPCPGRGLSLRRRHSSAVHVGLGLGRRVPHGAVCVVIWGQPQ